MKNEKLYILLILVAFAATVAFAGCTGAEKQQTEKDTITITDSLGREVTVPANPERVVCSGSGCLRYLTYLQAQDKIVGVDDMEVKENLLDPRPYAIANPQFKDYPLIGEFRGNDDPEKIVACNPEVIFKTLSTSPDEIDELSEKTGIPVVALNYGDLGVYRDDMYQSLRIMGSVMGKEDRAEDVIAFFDGGIADLEARTASVTDTDKKSTFIGGIAYKGPHGFQSTEPTYPPFSFINALTFTDGLGTEHADIAKEKIIEWDPDVLFVDLSTIQTTPSAIDELKTDEAYQSLSAVKTGEVYGVLPYNWYTSNQGSVIADAYYIGSILYPDKFNDIDPAEKADEIYVFLVGEPVFDQMNEAYGDIAFTKLSL